MIKKLYRPCVGICLINDQGMVFAGERIDAPNAWQMPQGGVDEGEDINTAAHRELLEETGTNQAKIIGQYPEQLMYDVPIEICLKHWGGAFCGQVQTWIYMRFTGQDSDINLNAHDPAEFAQWRWMAPEELKLKIVPFKVDIYEAVLEHVKHL